MYFSGRKYELKLYQYIRYCQASKCEHSPSLETEIFHLLLRDGNDDEHSSGGCAIVETDLIH